MTTPDLPPVPAPPALSRIRRGLARHRGRSLAQFAAARGWISADRLQAALDADEDPATLLVARGWISGEQRRELEGQLRAGEAGAPSGGSRYDRQEKIGEGGMAVVYRAVDRQLGRPVALKVLKEAAQASDQVRERFEREARVIASLSHPNIVGVHDVYEEEGRTCLVLELVEGEPLDRELPKRRSDRAWAVALLEKVARALHHAHQQGVVHRDLKPGNILLTSRGEPKVGDFGLAHISGGSLVLTRTGATLGTPAYMAPEQIRGLTGSISPRTDVYALGVILYEVLAGRRPHEGDSSAEVFRRKLEEEPLPPRLADPSVPADLETIALKALETDPLRRYATAEEFAEDLRRYAAGEAIQARPASTIQRIWKRAVRHRLGLAAAAASALLILVLAGWGVSHVRREEAVRDALAAFEKERSGLDEAERAFYRESSDPAAVLARIEAARGSLETAVLRSPDLATGHYLLGRAWDLLGRIDRAEPCWRRALEIDPGFTPARFHLGRLLLFRSFHALNAAPGSPAGDPEPLARAGAGEIDRALASGLGFEREIHRDIASAMTAYSRRDFPALDRITREAIAARRDEPGVEELHWLRSHLENVDAVAACNDALARRPWYVPALVTRGNLRTRRKEWDKARLDFDRALQLDPNRDLVWVNLAHVRQAQGDLEDALKDVDRALRINPSSALAKVNRANILAARGDLEGADREASEAIDLVPGLAAAFETRAAARYRRGRLDDAIKDAGEALRIDPSRAAARSIRGLVRWRQGDLDGALVDFDEAARQSPTFDNHAGRGELRRALGDLGGALEDAERAIVLRPDRPEGFHLRGMIRAQRDLLTEAVEDLKRALELPAPDWPNRAAARGLLDEIRGTQDH